MATIIPKADVAVRSSNDDDEYRRNYSAFEYVHALYALDHGWTGQGVLVGVVDDGVVENTELAGQLSALGKDFGNVTTNGKTTARNIIGDAYSDHGTLIAGVIAGRDDGRGIQGIAPGAKIVSLRVSDVNSTTREETLGRTLPAALDYAASKGVKVVNASLAKVDASQPSTVWSDMVARYAASGGLFVNSAGNDGEDNAKGYLDLTPANRDGWLFVTAVEDGGDGVALADYANRCGATAMTRCVAAMGTNATMDIGGAPVLFTGTSSATAQVSGLAALILGKWPQLSGVQAGQVILNTARDMGEAGIDPVYGAGLIDVEAALSPVTPTISNGTTQTSLSHTAMIIPNALGGAAASVAVKQMLSRVTMLDAYGRDYSGSLASLVADPLPRKGMLARQVISSAGMGSSSFSGKGFAGSVSYTSSQNGPAPENQRARMISGKFAASLGRTKLLATYSGQDAIQDEAMGLAPSSDVTIAYAPGANLSMGVQRAIDGGDLTITALNSDGERGAARGMLLGWNGHKLRIKAGYLKEDGTVFGNPVGAGALRFGDGARTAFLEMSRNWQVGGWSVDTYASMGATRLKIAADTLLTSARPILTQRAGVSASHLLKGGSLRMGVALPLTAFAGSGELTYATGYDLDKRSLLYDRGRISMTARYQPIVSVGYEHLGRSSSLRFAAATDALVSDWRALASWRMTLR